MKTVPNNLKQLSETQLAYLAGIVDGEGCISIRKISPPKDCVSPSYAAHLKVLSTDKPLIEWIFKTTGIGCILVTKQKPKRKIAYIWEIAHNSCSLFLSEIYSFLVIKKSQADIIFQFRKTFGPRKGNVLNKNTLQERENCFIKLKDLHQ